MSVVHAQNAALKRDVHCVWQEHPSLEIINFGRSLKLEHIESDRYRLEGTGNEIKLNYSLLVKTVHDEGQRLFKSLNTVERYTPLYTSPSFDLYQVSPKNISDFCELYSDLNANPAVSYVQPDVLQKHVVVAGENATTGTEVSCVQLFPKQGYAGKGVNVAIIDEGIDLSHSDLVKTKPIFSYDVHTKTLDSKPQGGDETHGTKVAGVIFSQNKDRKDIGISPSANLIAIRHRDTWTSKTVLTFHLANLNNADIINASWHSSWLAEPLNDVVSDISHRGRGGKGTGVVFAAGNAGRLIDADVSEASIESAIVVGTEDHLHSNYGNTVDITLCESSVSAPVPGGGYQTFSGTSLAAARVSGHLALLMEEYPDMKTSQLVEILKKRASAND